MKTQIIAMTIFVMVLTLIPMNLHAYRGELTICNGAEPKALDPALIEGTIEHRIYVSLFEGLVVPNAEDASPVPGVAKSWTVSPDGKTYTFKLRKCNWSDGTPITAHTVVKSWLRFLDPATASHYAWFQNMFIAGAEEYNSGKTGAETVQIRVLDDYTFQFDLIGPLPYVIGALTHYSFGIVPGHIIEKHGQDWTKPGNIVSNGPFILESWEPQSKLSVVPNPEYWDKGAVNLARVTYLPIDDQNTAHNVYLNGEADWNTDVPLDQLEDAELRDDFHVAPFLATYYYLINVQAKPFDNVKVRQALSMALNRDDLVKKVTKSGEIATGAMVPVMADYHQISGNLYNVEKAQRLIAEAGYPDGKGFPEFSVLYNTSDSNKKVAEYVQQQWSENLGVNCKLENKEWKTYLSTLAESQFKVSMAGWVGDYQDPNTFLDMFMTGGTMNDGKYSNTEYDRLIKKASGMVNCPERMATLQKAEKILIEKDQSIIPFYHYVSKNMIDVNKWGGWYTNTLDLHPTKDIYLK